MVRSVSSLLCLDVGTKRIGVAAADSSVPIAMPLTTIEVDGMEIEAITQIVKERSTDTIIVGLPRNQFGGKTQQTEYSEQFADKIKHLAEVVFQDESLTSVHAEEKLRADGRPFTKADIDSLAAALILQDYLEAHHVAK